MNKFAILCFLCLGLTTACGWQLRGSVALPQELQTMHVSARDQYGKMAENLRRSLGTNGVSVVESAAEAPYSLRILDQRSKRRAVSVGNNALAAEYEIILEVDYTIAKSDGGEVLPTKTVSVRRSYVYDQSDVLSKNKEERLIQQEMRRDLSLQIIRSLRFLIKDGGKRNG